MFPYHNLKPQPMKKNFIFVCLSFLIVFSFVACQPDEPKTSTDVTIISDAGQLAKRLVFTKQGKTRQQARDRVSQAPAPAIPAPRQGRKTFQCR